MISTEGIEWTLHKRWNTKFCLAQRRAKHGPGTRRRRKYWEHQAARILRKYPWASRPLRYAVNFDRILMPKIAKSTDGLPVLDGRPAAYPLYKAADLREMLAANAIVKYQSSGRYEVHFDKVVGSNALPYRELSEKEEANRRKAQEWKARLKVHPGVPGKSVKITIEEYRKQANAEGLACLDRHPNANVYYYDDIGFLSGTAGYAIVLDGKLLGRQVTMMS